MSLFDTARFLTHTFRSELKPKGRNPWPKCPGCWHRSDPALLCHDVRYHRPGLCSLCCPSGGVHPDHEEEDQL